MKNVTCTTNCMFNSLTQVIREHSSIVLSAGVVGASFGFGSGGITWIAVGAGVGMLLAIAYGYIPRMTDCVTSCPVQ